MVLMPLLSRQLTLQVILTMPLFLARLSLIPIKSLSICFRVIWISITTILKRRGCLTVPRLTLMSLIKMMLVMVSVAAISRTFGLLRFLLRLSFLAKSRLLPHLLTLWVCKLLMLICILTKNVITSCSVTMMLFLHLEVKPLMTLTTVLYLSCALISEIGRAVSRNAETDLVCRLLLENKNMIDVRIADGRLGELGGDARRQHAAV